MPVNLYPPRSKGEKTILVNAVTRYAQSLPIQEAKKMEALAGEQLHRGLTGLL